MKFRFNRNIENFFKLQAKSNNSWGIPILKPCSIDLNNVQWIGFNELNTHSNLSNVGIHFYIDDYRFERIWKQPDSYLNLFKRCKMITTPDFSVYSDMPKAMHLWQHYKRQWCGAYWQEYGINVIPSLSWGIGCLHEFSFLGIPKNSVCTTSLKGLGSELNQGIKELKQVIDIVQPKKLYINAGVRTREQITAQLMNIVEFDFINVFGNRKKN